MIRRLIILLLIVGCEDATEPIVCEQGLTNVNNVCQLCNEGYKEIDSLCYYQSDLDVLQDIIDVNESLSGEPLSIGIQEWNGGGRLTWLMLTSNQLTTLPESIGNLSNLGVLWLNDNQLTTLPESFCNLPIHWGMIGWFGHFTIVDNNLCPPYPDCLTEGEEFTDENGNGVWDESESYIDTNENGIYEKDYIGEQDCP